MFYDQRNSNEYPQHMLMNTHVFMENWRKLFFTYHQIPTLFVSLKPNIILIKLIKEAVMDFANEYIEPNKNSNSVTKCNNKNTTHDCIKVCLAGVLYQHGSVKKIFM